MDFSVFRIHLSTIAQRCSSQKCPHFCEPNSFCDRAWTFSNVKTVETLLRLFLQISPKRFEDNSPTALTARLIQHHSFLKPLIPPCKKQVLLRTHTHTFRLFVCQIPLSVAIFRASVLGSVLYNLFLTSKHTIRFFCYRGTFKSFSGNVCRFWKYLCNFLYRIPMGTHPVPILLRNVKRSSHNSRLWWPIFLLPTNTFRIIRRLCGQANFTLLCQLCK